MSGPSTPEATDPRATFVVCDHESVGCGCAPSASQEDPARYDPLTGVGWPRPRGVEERTQQVLPVPYIALSATEDHGEVFSAATFASARSDLVVEQWRCQVCGQPTGTDDAQTCFAPISEAQWSRTEHDPILHISGGPLCSMPCSRLSLRVCPHFAGTGVIVTFSHNSAEWLPDETVLTISRAALTTATPHL